MNRKEFFKKLGIGVVTIVVAPKVIAEIKPPVNSVIWDEEAVMPKNFDSITVIDDLRKYPMTYRECYSPEEIIRIRKQTGDLIYQMCPYQESLQQSWMKLYAALEKAKP